jgi:hypothetical protein
MLSVVVFVCNQRPWGSSASAVAPGCKVRPTSLASLANRPIRGRLRPGRTRAARVKAKTSNGRHIEPETQTQPTGPAEPRRRAKSAKPLANIARAPRSHPRRTDGLPGLAGSQRARVHLDGQQEAPHRVLEEQGRRAHVSNNRMADPSVTIAETDHRPFCRVVMQSGRSGNQ